LICTRVGITRPPSFGAGRLAIAVGGLTGVSDVDDDLEKVRGGFVVDLCRKVEKPNLC